MGSGKAPTLNLFARFPGLVPNNATPSERPKGRPVKNRPSRLGCARKMDLLSQHQRVAACFGHGFFSAPAAQIAARSLSE